jgi:hypothetical protein
MNLALRGGSRSDDCQLVAGLDGGQRTCRSSLTGPTPSCRSPTCSTAGKRRGRLTLTGRRARSAPRDSGELTAVSGAPAIANAVYHATGKRMRDPPITLENALELLTV